MAAVDPHPQGEANFVGCSLLRQIPPLPVWKPLTAPASASRCQS